MGFAAGVSECSVQLIKTNTSYIILIAFKWRYMKFNMCQTRNVFVVYKDNSVFC